MKLDQIKDVYPLEICSISLQTSTIIAKLEAHDNKGEAIACFKSSFDLEAFYSDILGDDFDEIGVPAYNDCLEDSERMLQWIGELIQEEENKGVFCDPNSEYEAFKTTKVQRDRKSKR